MKAIGSNYKTFGLRVFSECHATDVNLIYTASSLTQGPPVPYLGCWTTVLLSHWGSCISAEPRSNSHATRAIY